MNMLQIPVPIDKLKLLQEKLGITEDTLRQIDPYREVFTGRKHLFAEYFSKVFQSIPDAKLILDYAEHPGIMPTIWANWFEKIFRSQLDQDLYSYLWRIGLRHVEVNLDQRFSNLGFSIIRQFCHGVVLDGVGHGNRTAVLQALDKLIDFCLLVETSAYIEATTRCDIEIIKGIADRVRNPVTVIGGSIRRLQKKVEADSPAYEVYASLLAENRRLEHMVLDIKTYFEMFQAEPRPQSLELREIIREQLSKLQANGAFSAIRVETDFPPDAVRIRADRDDMAAMLYHVFENAFEAADPQHGLVKVSFRPVLDPHPDIQVKIFNTGEPFRTQELDKLSSPFFSTKPAGTGFGIPIIRLALRKNHGKIAFDPVPGQGTTVIVTIPAAHA